MEKVIVPYDTKVKFPDACVHCLKPRESDGTKTLIGTTIPEALKTKEIVFEIYVCSLCFKHWKSLKRYNKIMSILLIICVLIIVGAGKSIIKIYDREGFWISLLASLILGGIIAGIVLLISLPFKPKKFKEQGHIDNTTEPIIITYETEGDKEYLEFDIANDKYASLFKEINSIKENIPKSSLSSEEKSFINLTTDISTPHSLKVLNLLKGLLPEDGLFVSPDIPLKKLGNATYSCGFKKDEKVLGLIDCTVWGSAKNCILFGTKGVHYHNGLSKTPGKGFISYDKFKIYSIVSESNTEVCIDSNIYIELSGCQLSAKKVLSLFKDLQSLLKKISE